MTDVIKVLDAAKVAKEAEEGTKDLTVAEEEKTSAEDLLEDVLDELRYGNRLAQGRLVMDALKLFAFILFIVALASSSITITGTVISGS